MLKNSISSGMTNDQEEKNTGKAENEGKDAKTQKLLKTTL